MKKKIMLIVLSVVMLFSTAFALTACGEDDHSVVYTIMNGEEQVAVVHSVEELKNELDKSVTKEGCRLKGVFLDKECKKQLDLKNIPEGDLTFYYGWEEFYNKATLQAEATLDIGITVTLSAGATVFFRETDEGIDFVINADACVSDEKYLAELYYVDGVLVVGIAEGEGEMTYTKEDIGTVKEIESLIISKILENDTSRAIYEFVVDLMEKNQITFELSDLKKLFIFEPNYTFSKPVDFASDVQSVIDFLVENKDSVIYDTILGAIIDSQGVPADLRSDAIEAMKKQVEGFIDELLDDEITVEDFLNKLLGLAGLDLDTLFGIIDSLQLQYKIETQAVIDLINQIAGTTLPEANEGQTITSYALSQLDLLALMMFQETNILDVKVVDIISAITGDDFSFAMISTIIKGMLPELTFGTAIELVVALVGAEDFDVDEFFIILSAVSIDELTLKVELEADENGLPVYFMLETSDEVSVADSTFSVDANVTASIEYGLYAANVFVLPEIAG